nr:histidine phosphatase family protein [Mucilaginibacter sp. L294]
MKEVWFIRHGESEANAGFATTDHARISLTEVGHMQSTKLADRLEKQPNLFIVTSFLRTQQTAEPALNKYPDVPIEVWPLHEFDYLSASQCVNTTAADRKPWVNEFWSRCDPDYVHGTGAESFFSFRQRVVNCITDLEFRKENLIVVFTHGQVMRAIYQYVAFGRQPLSMKLFRDEMLKISVPNTGVFKCRYINNHLQISESGICLI